MNASDSFVKRQSAKAIIFFHTVRCASLAIVLTARLLLASASFAKNQAQERAEAVALIDKALSASDLRALGSPPFQLRGTLAVPLSKGKSATGTCILDWASPDRWREEIHVANYSRIRAGGAGKYRQLRSLNYELTPFDDFSASFD
jgi:hypothetical protein